MSPHPKHRGFLALSIAVGLWNPGCTLTSDAFTLAEASGPLQPSPDAGGTSSDPVPSTDGGVEPEMQCSREGEGVGCDIELMPGSSCESDLDCASNACVSGACVVTRASCRDGVLNGDEVLTDCGGGSCPGCPVGTSCNQGADCLTGVCGEDDSCSPPSCDDDVRNQDETGVDCGGACSECGAGQPCGAAGDCQSGVCGTGGCDPGVDRCCQAPSCDDEIRNGDEPVTDCGNAACGPCPEGSPCSANAECASGFCRDGFCRPPPCADEVRNGSETDTDCGGSDASCARCDVGDTCAGNTDCASGSCINQACVDCDDGRRNGTETGVDCGGVCGSCGPGQACNADAECQSGACQDGRCCGGTLVDCTRCARRLAQVLDCNSNGPAGAADCTGFLDCLAANTNICSLRYAPGCSEDPGGVCNHTDFGGDGGPGVGLADAILGTAGCTFGTE